MDAGWETLTFNLIGIPATENGSLASPQNTLICDGGQKFIAKLIEVGLDRCQFDRWIAVSAAENVPTFSEQLATLIGETSVTAMGERMLFGVYVDAETLEAQREIGANYALES